MNTVITGCPSTGTHGSRYAWNKYGCRCPQAEAAIQRRRAQERARDRQRKRDWRANNTERKTARRYIDHVAVERACRGERLPLSKYERWAAIDQLDKTGATAPHIATLLDINRRTVQRRRRRRLETAAA